MFRSVHDSKENVESKTLSVVYFNTKMTSKSENYPKKLFKIIFWLSTQAWSTGTGNERLMSKKMNCQNSINTFRELDNNNRVA